MRTLTKALLSSILLPAILLLAALPAHAQGNTVTILFPGVPSGGCAFVMFGIDAANGALYNCNAGTWALVSGSATCTNNLTMNNSGSGAASGATFNCSTAVTLSYNTLGASPLAGSTSLVTVGTIGTGTWGATPVAPQYGGTGQAWNASSGLPQLNSGAFSLYSTVCANGLTSAGTAYGCLSAAPVKSGDTAGGDLGSTYPNPTVLNLHFGATNQVSLCNNTPTNNYVVYYHTSCLDFEAAAGGGNVSTSGSPTTGYLPKWASGTTIGNSLCDEGVTTANTLTCTDTAGLSIPKVATTSDGTHPSSISLVGNTTLPTLITNTVTILGPPSATPTAWSLQVPTAIPTTTDLFSCVVTGTNCLLTDSGIASANAVTASAAAAAANQVCESGGANKTCVYADLPYAVNVPSANCNNATAGTGWSLPTSAAPTVACRTGTNVQAGVLQFAASNSAQFNVAIPTAYDSSGTVYARIRFTQAGNTTASQTIIMQMATGCSTTTDDPSFNTAQAFGTATTTATANTPFDETLSGVTMTGCTAGHTLNVKISRSGSDTATTSPNVYFVVITFPTLPTMEAY